MITLNRPYRISTKVVAPADTLYDRKITWLYSSREGLNMIYQHLYKERGSLCVAVSPMTCFVALYPIVQNGHSIVFVDIDETTLNMDVDKLLVSNHIDVVQVIHLAGNPMPMDRVQKWAKKNNVVVVEDCAQALGAIYDNKPVGTFGDYAVYSAVKNLYTPMGGILISKEVLPLINTMPTSKMIDIYKSIKWWLEKHTNANKLNIFNCIYSCLLNLSNKNEAKGKKIHFLKPKQKALISEVLGLQQQIQAHRDETVNKLLSLIDREKYAIQQEVQLGVSNRNRIMLVAKKRQAIDIILDLRECGIAANNLTQSYVCPYQNHVFKDAVLGKYYTQNLEVYERILPRIVAIPSSPALTNEEIKYIVNCVNQFG